MKRNMLASLMLLSVSLIGCHNSNTPVKGRELLNAHSTLDAKLFYHKDKETGLCFAVYPISGNGVNGFSITNVPCGNIPPQKLK